MTDATMDDLIGQFGRVALEVEEGRADHAIADAAVAVIADLEAATAQAPTSEHPALIAGAMDNLIDLCRNPAMTESP